MNTLEKISDNSDALIEDFSYDDCGNQLTAGASRHYIWTAANRLLVYKNQTGSSDPTIFAQYDYDGAGNRISKLVRTGSGNPTYTRTIYIDGIFEYHKLENGTTYEKNYVHVMDDQSRIAMVRLGDQFPDDISESVIYNLENQIKSSSARLDTNGTVIDREEFYPFGDSSMRTFSKKRYRYVGKEKDLESGLYYYGARYYSAWTCRFISVDALAKKYNQLTPYQNAGNNPINDRDIDGNQGDKTAKGGGNKEGKNGKGDNGKGGDGDKPSADNIPDGLPPDIKAEVEKAMENGENFEITVNETPEGDISYDLKTGNEVEVPDSNDLGDYSLPDYDPEFGVQGPQENAAGSAPKVDIDPMPNRPTPEVQPKYQERALKSPSKLKDQNSVQAQPKANALEILRATMEMWAEKTAKLLDWAGENASKASKLFRGAGTALGIIGGLFSLHTYRNDLKTKPRWIADVKLAVGLSIAIIGIATPVGWGMIAVGFIYGMAEGSGLVDKGLLWIDKNIVNPPEPQYQPRTQ